MSGVSAHNALAIALAAEATRYGYVIDIDGPFTEGDPAHVAAHNRVCIAMIELRDYANNVLNVDPTVVISLPDEAFPGDTGHVADHVLIAAALAVLQAVTIP